MVVESVDRIQELRKTVRVGVGALRGLDIADQLQVEILSQLIENRATLTELVLGIYGVANQDPGFNSCFSRVRRAARRLESKGLVSRGLFGNDRPYRLTDLAVTNLAKIGGGKSQIPVLPRRDMAIYLATGLLALPAAMPSSLGLAEIGVVAAFSCFSCLLGVSCCKFTQMLWRVI